MNDLFRAEYVDAGDTRAVSTNIYRFCKFDELGPGNIGPANKNWNLKAETGRTASRRGFQTLLVLQNFNFHRGLSVLVPMI
jgi:hypothetical protein